MLRVLKDSLFEATSPERDVAQVSDLKNRNVSAGRRCLGQERGCPSGAKRILLFFLQRGCPSGAKNQLDVVLPLSLPTGQPMCSKGLCIGLFYPSGVTAQRHFFEAIFI